MDKPSRISSGSWKKGQSGNPGGRPKGSGLSEYIRKRTKDGFALAEFMVRIIQGVIPEVTIRDKIAAVDWLAKYGFGLPNQAVFLQSETSEQKSWTIVHKIINDPDSIDLVQQLGTRLSKSLRQDQELDQVR